MSIKPYNDMSLGDLKTMLKGRGIKSTGKKKDLIVRLQSLDQMNIPLHASEPEYSMILPDPSIYRDVTTESRLPVVTEDTIKAYLDTNGKRFEEKFKHLYYEKFIRFVRVAENEEGMYFYGVVWAEMRKSVTYRCDILINKQSTIAEAQCECGAGQGPSAHCKHVATVLYSLSSIRRSGEIHFEQTCTQKLQKFHKAKVYRGSPKKAAQLKPTHPYTFDPRPQKFRNNSSYAAHFRSTVLNYRGDAGNMPVLQLYQPANAYGVVADHDYCGSAEESYIKEIQIEKTSADYVTEVADLTKEQASCQLWHDVRTTHISSSRYGEICKATDRRDVNKLLASLITPKQFSTQATNHGKIHEATAKKLYTAQYGGDVLESGFVISRSHPYLGASPDGLVGNDIVLEVKCPYVVRDKCITPKTVPFLDEGGLKRNHQYYYQVQGQLFCTERSVAHFCVYTFQDFRVFVVERDEIFINDMVSRLTDFYTTYYKPALLEKNIYRDYAKYFM